MCWGSNSEGQRGDGSVPGSLIPVPVVGFEGPEVPLPAPWLVLLAATLLGVEASRRRRLRARALSVTPAGSAA